MLLPKPRLRSRKTGFTLLETAAAVGFVGTFIAVLITLSANVLGVLRTAKDNVSANQALQQRVEDLRIASWGQVWDPTLMSKSMLATPSPSTAGLSQPVETVVVSPYPDKAGFVPAKVVVTNGVPAVVSANAALKNERMVRIDISLTWKGFPKKRNRARTATILMANKGDEN
jgi:hypothetical protein